MTKKLNLLVIERVGCNGDMELVKLYDPIKKVFFDHNNNTWMSSSEWFQRLLRIGISKTIIEPYLSIKEMKVLWSSLISSITPKFQDGDRAIQILDKRASIVTVGEITNYTEVCSYPNRNSKIRISRNFVFSATGKTAPIQDEADLLSISDFEIIKENKKIASQIRKVLKKEGIIGATLVYGGEAYSL